jgi:hypothetical protein
MKYEHAVGVTVTVVTHIVTDSPKRESVDRQAVFVRAAEVMRSWTPEDVEGHMEASGVEYIEALRACCLYHVASGTATFGEECGRTLDGRAPRQP